MSNVQTCEKGETSIEAFISALAYESADIIARKIPDEYRGAYLSTYAAGLALAQAGGLYV